MTYSEVIRSPWWTYAVAAGLAGLFCFTFAAVVGLPTATILFVLIFAVLAIMGLGVLGLVMLIVGGLRHGAGRSGKGLLIGGLVLMIPALWVFSQVY